MKWYFDWKRGKSVRLGMLSDQEIMALLSAHDYFEASTTHLIPTLFPGVSRLILNTNAGLGGKEVVAVATTAGDKLMLKRPVRSKGIGADRLEDWMNRLELSIETTVIECNTNAYNQLQDVMELLSSGDHVGYEKAFVKWAVGLPQQSVELVRRAFFTKHVEQALQPMNENDLPLPIQLPEQV